MGDFLKCFIDLDNTLVDFTGGALRLHNIEKSIEDFYNSALGDWHYLLNGVGKSAEDFYKDMEYDYWASLDWMKDGREILEACESIFGRENCAIVTSPTWNSGCVPGKRAWIQTHLDKWYHKHVHYSSAKEDFAYANSVLVDDSDDNIKAFENSGGHVCLVPRAWNKMYQYRFTAAEMVLYKLKSINGIS